MDPRLKAAGIILNIVLIAGVTAYLFVPRQVHHDEQTNPIRSVKAEQVVSKPLSILFVGDIMLGRYVETLRNQLGADYPFINVDSLLNSADVVVANLEGPITDPHIQTPSNNFNFSFDSSIGTLLNKHHIATVTLANNHTYDYGLAGFNTTVSVLDQAGINHFGNPVHVTNQDGLKKTINGQQIIFVGINATNPLLDITATNDFIKNIERRQGDLLVVFVHGGTEYSIHSTEYQQQLYRSFIDSGADVVIGAHPHVIEEIEQYKGKLIFYSLGNFIFDQYFSDDVQQELAVKVDIASSTLTYNIIPLVSELSQPRLATSSEYSSILANLSHISSPELLESIQKCQIVVQK